MTAAWIQCAAGASGDMLLGALLDAGASLDVVRSTVAGVAVEPVDVEVERVRRGGFAALKAHVRVSDDAAHRTWADVRAPLDKAELSDAVRERSLEVFDRLASAEGQVHGVPADEIHFHEVGALDAIADVVGVCAAVADLGIGRVVVGEVAVGTGTVRTEHGTLPVPPPAVLALLADAAARVPAGPVEHETCTPTGALPASLAEGWGPKPRPRLRRVGVGAGSRDHAGTANVLRVVLGDLR